MSKGPNYAKGEAVRRELIGEGEVTKISETVYDDPMMQKFRDYAIEAVFGMLWTRPGLDKKTRALICVVSDTAIHAWPELKLHLRGAITNGVSRDEIKEILLQACIYAGIPAGLDAFKVADGVFKEMDAK